MILLTHICDMCHKAEAEEITLEPGQVVSVNMPDGWVNGICPECIHTLKIEQELEAEADKRHGC